MVVWKDDLHCLTWRCDALQPSTVVTPEDCAGLMSATPSLYSLCWENRNNIEISSLWGPVFGLLLLETHYFLETCPSTSFCQTSTHTTDPASYTKLGLALIEKIVSLLLKWFAELEVRVHGTERCTAVTTDLVKEFGDTSYLLRNTSHLLRGTAIKTSHSFASKMSLCMQVTRICSLNGDNSWKCFKIHLQVTSSRQAGCH